MEESADYVLNKNNLFLDNDIRLNSIDVSNNDPIPPLFIPKNTNTNKTKDSPTIISQIISDVYNNYTPKTNKELNMEKIGQIIKAKISYVIPRQNLEKHNSTPNKKNIMLINDLMESKETHFIATFKDYLISDFHEEFLRRYFQFHETKEILPKFYHYYKNYLNFFCKGIFCDFYLNEVMQEYGECQAEFYYNKNYGHKDRMKKKEKKELNELNNQNEDSYESENGSNNINIRSIFSKSIKYSIDIIQNSQINGNMETQKDLSNIKPVNYSKDNSITLPDNSSVSYNDVITNQNSLRYIINMINNKNELNKKIKNKKSEIISNKNKNRFNNCDSINYIINNNFKKIINNNKNVINKKENQTLSKTNSNANIKNKVKTRIKSSNTKSNHLNNNNINNKSKGNQNISNYKKYIEFLANKQRNKSNDPKIKISQDEFTYSLQKINKNIKTKNVISPLSPNGLMSHFNFFSPNNQENKKPINNNIINNNNPNKVSSSLFLINNLFNKTTRNSSKYNTIFPLSTLKNNLSKNKSNNNNKDEKYEKKEKKKLLKKDKVGNMNNNNKYMHFNPNISIKSVKNLSPQSRNINNNNNYNSTNNSKPLSYSTVNNCNININNNIILSNNYFNNKNYHPMNGHHQINSLTKKKFDKKMKQKNNLINKSLTKTANSRNYNKNDLNRFKTEVNILNLLNQEKEKTNKNTNNYINNMNQYKSFRKSNNYEIFSKMKKYNNNTHNRNLSLKNIPVTVKSNLNNNFSMNKTGKILDEYDLNLTSKTYKHFYLKKNSNSVHQNKIIFDYKRK